MRGLVSVDKVMTGLSAARRTAVEKRGAELLKRAQRRMTLKQIRLQRKLNQSEIAAALGIGQMQISRLEGRRDPKLSTLERTVAAMGGTLTLVATFPDQEPVVLVSGGEN